MALLQQGRSLSSVIARFAYQLRFDQLPQPVIDSARQHLLDTVGCCLAARNLDSSRALASYLRLEGGAGQATAIGIRRRLPAAQAAFMNGLLARSLEYDDMACPTCIPPALLPLLRSRLVSGKAPLGKPCSAPSHWAWSSA